jgi:RNA polymerase sigma-70 factor (ECF subfamily)
VNPADWDLLRAYWDRGDDATFKLLFDRHRDSVTSYSWRIVHRREEAEEICIEAFCKLLRQPFEPFGSFRGYLLTVVRRLSIDALRRRSVRQRLDPAADHSDGAADSPEQAAVQSQQHAGLERALATLDIRHREVLLLYYNQGLTSDEAGLVLGCTGQQ